MIVTGIEPFKSKKHKVFLDGEFAFALYASEMRKYGIETGAELDEAVFDEINREIVSKRAKARTLHLLMHLDRTESQVAGKLRDNGYTEAIIQEAVDYAKSFRYIDDLRYAKNYVHYKSASKSHRQIRQDLIQKGVAKDLITEAFAAREEQDEYSLIQKLIHKKGTDLHHADDKEMQKLYAFLMRKGFKYEDVAHVIRELKN